MFLSSGVCRVSRQAQASREFQLENHVETLSTAQLAIHQAAAAAAAC